MLYRTFETGGGGEEKDLRFSSWVALAVEHGMLTFWTCLLHVWHISKTYQPATGAFLWYSEAHFEASWPSDSGWDSCIGKIGSLHFYFNRVVWYNPIPSKCHSSIASMQRVMLHYKYLAASEEIFVSYSKSKEIKKLVIGLGFHSESKNVNNGRCGNRTNICSRLYRKLVSDLGIVCGEWFPDLNLSLTLDK